MKALDLPAQQKKTDRRDAMATTLSGLCLLHCLALPALAVLVPALATLAEAEWVHRALVLIAIPLSVSVALRVRRPAFVAAVVVGLGLLSAAAFVHVLEPYETPLTVLGAITLGTAHGLRWWLNRAA